MLFTDLDADVAAVKHDVQGEEAAVCDALKAVH